MKNEDINETDSETAQLVRRLRTEADRLEPDLGAVEALVLGAVRQGRRRRTRRRVLTATAGLLAAAALTVVAASVLPELLSQGTTAVPIASSPSPRASASPSPTPSPTASTGSTSPAAVESVRSDVVAADVQDTLTGLLPDSLTVRQAESAREEGVDGFPWELTTALTVQDAKGTSRLFGGIGNGHYDDGCLGLADCQVTEVAGGTLWTVRSPAGDKSGADRSFYYNRPDGGHVWFSQRNFASGSGPVTRDGLPLSDSAGRRLVTSQAWDQLFGS